MPIIVDGAASTSGYPFGESVTVLTAGSTTDPYSGGETADWSTPTESIYTGVAVADGGSLEPLQDARNMVESDFDLIFRAEVPITAQDRVIVRGLTCDVVGRPFLWRNPFTGWTPGLVVRVKIWEG